MVGNRRYEQQCEAIGSRNWEMSDSGKQRKQNRSQDKQDYIEYDM